MRRIRWTDLPEDPAMLSGWQLPSLVLATLFFNFFFWYVPATTFPFIGSPILYLASLGTVIALVAVFFFLCPALAAHRTRKSLFQLAEASFGVVPAIGFRIGCVMLCMLWLAGTTGVLFNNVLRFVLQRSLTLVEVSLFLGLPVRGHKRGLALVLGLQAIPAHQHPKCRRRCPGHPVHRPRCSATPITRRIVACLFT